MLGGGMSLVAGKNWERFSRSSTLRKPRCAVGTLGTCQKVTAQEPGEFEPSKIDVAWMVTLGQSLETFMDSNNGQELNTICFVHDPMDPLLHDPPGL